MRNSEYFAQELAWIGNKAMRQFATEYVDLFPPYFEYKPASSTGKYHPTWGNGEGGLRRHTRAVMFWVHELADTYELTALEHDALLVAAVAHDAVKYGLPEKKFTDPCHDAVGAMFFSRFAKGKDLPHYKDIYLAIAEHMGQWGHYPTRRHFPEDFSRLSQLLHVADMCGSRKGVRLDILEENLIG